MNFGPQHMVERGQEMVTKIEGELLDGLHLNTQVEYEDTKESQALAKMSLDDLDKIRHVCLRNLFVALLSFLTRCV